MNSVIIARLMGPLLLTAALSILLNRKAFQRMAEDAPKHAALFYLTGALSLLGGLAIVEFHNVWVAGWQVLITVVGWLAVLRGVARMLFPEQAAALAARMIREETSLVISAVVSSVIGAILTVEGLARM